MESLPGDMLAATLALLPPRSLAACRSVCKAWRATVDAGGLLRPDLLPLSVRGVFVETAMAARPKLFQRPPPPTGTGPEIAGAGLDYLDEMGYDLGIPIIQDCCNGLVLLDGCVVNPATRLWARLPPYPPAPEGIRYAEYLLFEPAVSPHYQVVRLPYAPPPGRGQEDVFPGEVEWPPDPCMIQVFSSSSSGAQRWEDRSLVREGEAACTFGELRLGGFYRPYSHYAACWKEALYVHCEIGFLMRIALSDGKYQVTKMPAATGGRGREVRLGKSKNGVYCALVCTTTNQLQIWLLHEFSGERDWVLMHDANLEALSWHVDRNLDHSVVGDPLGPWTFKPNSAYCYCPRQEPKEEDKLEWDSDDDNVLVIEDVDRGRGSVTIPIMGFHPYKEVIFLHVELSSAVAYHWNSSKIQFMGELCLLTFETTAADSFFVYTPCWIGDLQM